MKRALFTKAEAEKAHKRFKKAQTLGNTFRVPTDELSSLLLYGVQEVTR